MPTRLSIIPAFIPLEEESSVSNRVVPVVLCQDDDSLCWFDSSYCIIPETHQLSTPLNVLQPIRVVPADRSTTVGVCGVVMKVSGWDGNMVFVDVLVWAGPSTARYLTIGAFSHHLSKYMETLWARLKKMHQEVTKWTDEYGAWSIFCARRLWLTGFLVGFSQEYVSNAKHVYHPLVCAS